MDYFEYLNKNAEQIKPKKLENAQVEGASQGSDINVFGEDLEVRQNESGASIFSFATTEQLNELDFEKIVSKEPVEGEEVEGHRETVLDNVLKNILSFEEVKNEADTDGDGEISAKEAKEYFLKLARKDGDIGSLTSEDFDIFLKEKNIDLEEVFNNQLQESSDSQESNTAVAQQEPAESSGVNTAVPPQEIAESSATNTDVTPQESVNNNSTQTQNQSQTYNISAPVGNSSINYSSDSYLSSNYSSASEPVKKTINNMSLDELKEEKTKRETTLTEKQNAVNAVNNGSNEKVQNAKKQEETSKNAMMDAIAKDNKVSEENKVALQKVLDNIAKNDKDLEENATKLSDNELASEKNDATIENLSKSVSTVTSTIGDLNGKISDLNSKISKIGVTEDTKQVAKKNNLEKQLSAKKAKLEELNKKLVEDKSSLEEAQKRKTELDTEKKELEEAKNELEKTKKEYDKERKELENEIKKDCSPETKKKIEAYENARKNVETVRAKELKSAKSEQAEALKSVKEVDAKITEVQNRKIKSASNNGILNIEDIPLSVRKRCSGAKIQTLPDGTEILTLGYTRLDQMQPEMIQKIGEMQQLAQEEGLTFVVSDGSRTVNESNSSRARKGNVVAKGGSSPHNYGVAIDIALYKDGKDVSGDVVRSFAQKAKAETGIAWGGDFRSNGSQETHHYELANWRRKYKTQDNLITRHESIT